MENDVISDTLLSLYHCKMKDGFIFTTIVEPANAYNAIVIRNPSHCDCWSPKVLFSKHTLSEHIEYIRQNHIEEAFIIAESIDFLADCPSLKKVSIAPANSAPDRFDYSPLYHLNFDYLHVVTSYGGMNTPFHTTIDYRKLPSLTDLYIDGTGHEHYADLPSLKSLAIYNDKSFVTLPGFKSSASLFSLEIAHSRLQTMNGISRYPLKELNLYYNRTLSDVSDIAGLGPSLERLIIWNCPQIQDFSFLSQLTHLTHLVLMGSNKLPDVSFVENMPELKYFKFTMEIVDGNLKPCQRIPLARCLKRKRHYNIKLSE